MAADRQDSETGREAETGESGSGEDFPSPIRAWVSYAVAVAVLLVVLGGGVALYQYFAPAERQAGSRPPVSVTATTAERRRWRARLTATGTARAIQGTELSAERAGKVSSIEFESGTRVEQGDLLVALDTSTEEAELDTLRPQLRQAKSDQRRAVELLEQNAISEQNYEEALAEVDRLQARIAEQQARIDQKRIVAPFSGEIGLRQVDLGQYLSPGTPVATLQQISPIFIDFELPESQLGKVASGQTVRATTAAYPEDTFEGEVVAVNPLIQEATRSVRVRARFPNEQRQLRPGMFADVTVELPDDRQVVAVPQTAVTFNAYGRSVFLVKEQTSGERKDASSDFAAPDASRASPESAGEEASGDASGGGPSGDAEGANPTASPRWIAQRRFVRTGERRGLEIEIVEGVQPGDRVVTAGQLKLDDGSPVTIVEEGVRQGVSPRPVEP